MKGRPDTAIRKFMGTVAARIFAAVSCISAVFAAVSCEKHVVSSLPTPYPETIDKVLIMYSAGQNNLAAALAEDIGDLCGGYLPRSRDRVLLLSYQRLNSRYTTSVAESYLIRYSIFNGRLAADTLKRFPADRNAASAATMNEVLTYVRDNFPAGSYGMLFSSHATGWLPAGYYSNSSYYDNLYGTGRQAMPAGIGGETCVPLVIPERDPALPPVKSIGADYVYGASGMVSYEMDLREFAAALPMHMDYIFFDCCLMGGIEVAYELRDRCDRIIFSPTEVLAEGFDYRTMGERLLRSGAPDLEGICRDYYEYYSNHEDGGYMRSATVSLVDCAGTGHLAEVCRRIFDSHRDGLAGIMPDEVQQYYTGRYHWFYDLYDIAVHAGASGEELAELQDAIDGCIIYKAATDRFLGIPIETSCGLSMYLPCNGSAYLDNEYRKLAWNQAAGLVM